MGRRRRPAQEQAHAGAVVDLDAHRAGHTVAAAPAEIAAQFGAVLLDDGPQFIVHPGRVVDVGEELVQLGLPLDAPDGQDAIVLGLEGIGGGTVGDEAAGQALHRDEAHLFLLAEFHKFQFLRAGDVAERELQRLVQTALDGFLRHGQAVVGDADVPDQTLGLRFQRGIVQAGGVSGPGAEGRVVELVDVNVVGAQVFQGGMQILPEILCGFRRRLGGDVDIAADAVERLAQLDLAVGVGAGGIKEADARLVSLAGQMDGVLLGDALDGQGTKAVLVHRDAGAAQRDHILHIKTSLWFQTCSLSSL